MHSREWNILLQCPVKYLFVSGQDKKGIGEVATQIISKNDAERKMLSEAGYADPAIKLLYRKKIYGAH